MARRHVEVAPVQPIALRRDEAAAALGVSVETFDQHVRPHLPALRLGGVTVYAVNELERFARAGTDLSAAETIRRGRHAA